MMSNKCVALQAAPETLLSRCARPKPKLVCVNGVVVGNAVVVVLPRDPNWWRNHLGGSFDGEVKVVAKFGFVRRL